MRDVEHRTRSSSDAPGAATRRARWPAYALALWLAATLALPATAGAPQSAKVGTTATAGARSLRVDQDTTQAAREAPPSAREPQGGERERERDGRGRDGDRRGFGGRRSRPTGSVVAGVVEVHHWPGGEALAAAILEPTGVLEPMPGLPADALETGPPIRVYLAPDAERFGELTGGHAPEWGAGVAMPDAGVIVLPGYSSSRTGTRELPRILRHELAHVTLYRHVAPSRVPRWFSEGYATWAAGQLDPEAGWILRLSFLAGSAPPLDSLTIAWPAGRVDARIAYLLSASVLEYLHARGGERVLGIFLDEWKASGSLDDALRGTYGLNIGQLERYWSRDVRRRYGWLVFLAQTTVIWAIAAALVIVLSAARRRSNRLRLERLREVDRREAELLDGLYDTSIESRGSA